MSADAILDVPTGVSTAGRLAPIVTADDEFFWQGAAAGRLVVQECGACGHLRNPPGPMCPACQSMDWTVTALSGRGAVHTYAFHHRPPMPGFPDGALVALIELDEGPRLISNLTGVAPRDVSIGDRVIVAFAEQAEGWTAHHFVRDEDGTRA